MNYKTLKKYHQLNVTLDSGVAFMIKVRGEDLMGLCEWLDSLSGIAQYDEVTAVNPMRPHVTKEWKPNKRRSQKPV